MIVSNARVGATIAFKDRLHAKHADQMLIHLREPSLAHATADSVHFNTLILLADVGQATSL